MTTEVKSRTCAPEHGAGGVSPPLWKIPKKDLSLSLSLSLCQIAPQGNDCKVSDVSKLNFPPCRQGIP